MSKRIPMLLLICLIVTLPALAHEHPSAEHPAAKAAAPTVAEQMVGLQAMCDASADARTERHTENALYNRLGGYDKIHALTKEILRLHRVNDTIKHTMEGVNDKMLAKHLADFMAAGIGGEEKYTGRDLPSTHVQLKLTDAHFMAAGSDVIAAMKGMEYGQHEIDEVVCILVSLKDQVVFK